MNSQKLKSVFSEFSLTRFITNIKNNTEVYYSFDKNQKNKNFYVENLFKQHLDNH